MCAYNGSQISRGSSRRITKDLKNLLIEYTIDRPVKFKDFIRKNENFKLNYLYLASNPAAIHVIEKHIGEISW